MGKVKEFVKKHKVEIGCTAGGVVLVLSGLLLKKKFCNSGNVGIWDPISLEGLSGDKVRRVAKWNSRDEWNGVVMAGLHKVTMDELAETGKTILKRGGLDENTIIEEAVFITTKDK